MVQHLPGILHCLPFCASLRLLQLLRAMKEQPTERELILDAIAIIGNATEPEVARRNALEALQLLVEPIDHANGVLGGVGLLGVCAWVGECA